jgi:hypothetical protein
MKNLTEISFENLPADTTQSKIYDIRFNYGFAVQFKATATVDGTFRILGSNDLVNWSVIETQAVTSTTLYAWNKDAIHYAYVKLEWLDTSSGASDTVYSTISVKGG